MHPVEPTGARVTPLSVAPPLIQLEGVRKSFGVPDGRSFEAVKETTLAIERALASQPDVLLCDEPTSALDAETTESLLATLADINRSLGVTIVVVTHELSVVTALCRHVAVVEDGAIVERLALDDVTRPPP